VQRAYYNKLHFLTFEDGKYRKRSPYFEKGKLEKKSKEAQQTGLERVKKIFQYENLGNKAEKKV